MKLLTAIKRHQTCINKASLLIIAIISCFFIFDFPAAANSIESFSRLGVEIPNPPSLNARSAILIDAATGTVLFEKEADIRLPPASLTKLVTLHIVMEEIKSGRLSPDEIVEIDPQDCSPSIPYGSSLMYLQPGMKVSVKDLMLGAAVVSGNDAAYSLARRIAGSNEEFAEMMNKEVKAMGFQSLCFVEPSGLSEFNLVTARDFAFFCKKYIELHPKALKELHSVHSIQFPRPEHATSQYRPNGIVLQYNRNPLIFSYEGADGLKTGYIIEVGYNMAATAMRNGNRFIAVLLGGSSTPYADGAALRTRDTKALFDWAFANFATARPGYIMPKPLRVWFGKSIWIDPEPEGEAAATVPVVYKDRVTARIETVKGIKAPVYKGQKLGEIVYEIDGTKINSVNLVSGQDIPRGNLFRTLLDSIQYFFAYIFGKL
ncbi:MAG TPA: D-alanyl-D-alanine carboxypeptidase family protein [Rectinema sp.]|nr:D-alanyl-D-alanine carboxypeptidase family protein [Spirochaetota bacterium]HOI98903.1 D-alanyl-D-alanine carboxypeptidase family protein [Rectinema sp.]HOR91697.1 D-alanyl-D-alanine carboxypeptidase family protein [Rectinema sp.]HPK78955.1 D-alanyl-D-alanine carboxypeptidase family protein [Rectinema sp.]